MDNLTPVFAIETITPYIRLTNTGTTYTLWVIVPLPVNYSMKLNNNPKLKIDEPNNQVDVTITVKGPTENPATEWSSIPLKIELPTPTDTHFGVDMKTIIHTTVVVKDTGGLGDGEGGSSNSKYEDSTEEG